MEQKNNPKTTGSVKIPKITPAPKVRWLQMPHWLEVVIVVFWILFFLILITQAILGKDFIIPNKWFSGDWLIEERP
ncbi:MAG: hypothetical protein PHY34_03570 [Patescibacteria group bacterium]|nr:hypothetical protein [Patescibacteria group bacterium]MDD5715638.1 hypothetical protein [Patescibacteria group bacterium]